MSLPRWPFRTSAPPSPTRTSAPRSADDPVGRAAAELRGQLVVAGRGRRAAECLERDVGRRAVDGAAHDDPAVRGDPYPDRVAGAAQRQLAVTGPGRVEPALGGEAEHEVGRAGGGRLDAGDDDLAVALEGGVAPGLGDARIAVGAEGRVRVAALGEAGHQQRVEEGSVVLVEAGDEDHAPVGAEQDLRRPHGRGRGGEGAGVDHCLPVAAEGGVESAARRQPVGLQRGRGRVVMAPGHDHLAVELTGQPGHLVVHVAGQHGLAGRAVLRVGRAGVGQPPDGGGVCGEVGAGHQQLPVGQRQEVLHEPLVEDAMPAAGAEGRVESTVGLDPPDRGGGCAAVHERADVALARARVDRQAGVLVVVSGREEEVSTAAERGVRGAVLVQPVERQRRVGAGGTAAPSSCRCSGPPWRRTLRRVLPSRSRRPHRGSRDRRRWARRTPGLRSSTSSGLRPPGRPWLHRSWAQGRAVGRVRRGVSRRAQSALLNRQRRRRAPPQPAARLRASVMGWIGSARRSGWSGTSRRGSPTTPERSGGCSATTSPTASTPMPSRWSAGLRWSPRGWGTPTAAPRPPGTRPAPTTRRTPRWPWTVTSSWRPGRRRTTTSPAVR